MIGCGGRLFRPARRALAASASPAKRTVRRNQQAPAAGVDRNGPAWIAAAPGEPSRVFPERPPSRHVGSDRPAVEPRQAGQDRLAPLLARVTRCRARRRRVQKRPALSDRAGSSAVDRHRVAPDCPASRVAPGSRADRLALSRAPKLRQLALASIVFPVGSTRLFHESPLKRIGG
jgi:hypothetical protein